MSNSWDDKTRQGLEPAQEGLTLILTVGNTLRQDDGAGPYIAECLQEAPGHLKILDAGDRPEDVIDEIVENKPVKTIIIDAADFGESPGTVRLIPEDLIPAHTLSTHTFPLPVISRIIAEDTGSEVVFIGIQPQDVSFGEKLSPSVKKASDEIVEFVQKEYYHA